jgi:sucrose phosphorylase
LFVDGNGAGINIHQLNCTYYSAVGCDDDRYLLARAIQLFARGIPQVYYVGLLAGENDNAASTGDGDGRAINRHDFSREEVETALRRPVVHRLIELMRLRNTHPAFYGDLEVETLGRSGFVSAGVSGRRPVRLMLILHRARAT